MNGRRKHAVMTPIAEKVTPLQRSELGAHFSGRRRNEAGPGLPELPWARRHRPRAQSGTIALISRHLSEADIAAVASYYAAQALPPAPADTNR